MEKEKDGMGPNTLHGDMKRLKKQWKKLYNNWIKSGKEEDYKLQITKQRYQQIKKAKLESSECFGKSLADDEILACRMFFKIVKRIQKRKNYNPTKIINGKNGRPLIESLAVIERWKEQFKDFLGEYHEETTQDQKITILEP